MTLEQQARNKFQQGHVERGSLYPEGIKAYCRTEGINYNTFYSWTVKLRRTRKAGPRLKTAHSFVPVVIDEGHSVMAQGKLPDAIWLASFAAELIRGLR